MPDQRLAFCRRLLRFPRVRQWILAALRRRSPSRNASLFQNLKQTDASIRCRIRCRDRDPANRSKPKNGFVWREAPERLTFRLLTVGVRRLARALKPVSAEDTPFRKAGASSTHSKGNAATNPEPVVRKRTRMPSKFDIGFVPRNRHVHDESVACPQSLKSASFREGPFPHAKEPQDALKL